MDRRAAFFLTSSVLCAVLVWPCPPQLRWVGWVLVIAFLVLAAISALDAFSRSRQT